MARTPIPVVVAGVVMVAAGAIVLTQLDRSVLPRLKETDLLIRWDGPPGASLPEMDRITTRATEELRGWTACSVDAHVGRAIRGDAVGGANTGEICELDPDADHDGTIASIEEVVNGYPGLDRKVLTYSQNQISDVLANETTPVRVVVYGQEHDVLQEKAGEIGSILAGIDGARTSASSPSSPSPRSRSRWI